MKSAVILRLGIVLVCAGFIFSAQGTTPILDDQTKKRIVDRVSEIQKQICLGVTGYSEFAHLHPTAVYFNYSEPGGIIDIELDSSLLAEGFSRIDADGKTRMGRRDKDEIFLRIRAQTTSSLTNKTHKLGLTVKQWEGKIEQVYQEEIPDENIVITVDAASDDGVFAKLVRDCLKRNPEAMKLKLLELERQLGSESDNSGAASLLVQVGEYGPVISALTNNSLAIQRKAMRGLFYSYHEGRDDQSIKGAVAPLLHLLKNQDSDVRHWAAMVLGRVHQEGDATSSALIAATEDESDAVAIDALLWLREFKSQEKAVVPVVIKKLSDSRAKFRAQAAQTLGELSPCSDKELARMVVAALIKSLEDTDNYVRVCAAWALGCNGAAAKEAVPKLLKWAKGNDKDLKGPGRAALMHIDFEAANKAGVVNQP